MDKTKLGVIVGRFQIPALHDGHKALFDHVFKHNDEVLIFIGVGGEYTFTNPLPYSYRKAQVASYCNNHKEKPSFIAPIRDRKSDDQWNNILNKYIEDYVDNHEMDVCLYGCRDSFLEVYKGPFRTEFVKDGLNHGISATDIRKGYHMFVDENSYDWAKGVIHATGKQYPTSYQCVDIVYVYAKGMGGDKFEILLGRKPGEDKWRLPGGFVDPQDINLEAAALRELKEETGIEYKETPHYHGSFRINDWRFKKEPHKIMTCLFSIFNEREVTPKAGDDLEEVKFFNLHQFADQSKLDELVEPEHHILIKEIVHP